MSFDFDLCLISCTFMTLSLGGSLVGMTLEYSTFVSLLPSHYVFAYFIVYLFFNEDKMHEC